MAFVNFRKQLGGFLFGRAHHRAKLSEDEVELIRTIRERTGVTYGQIADWFGLHRDSVRDICLFRRRPGGERKPYTRAKRAGS